MGLQDTIPDAAFPESQHGIVTISCILYKLHVITVYRMAVRTLNPAGEYVPALRYAVGQADQAFRDKSGALKQLRLTGTAAIHDTLNSVGYGDIGPAYDSQRLTASGHMEYAVNAIGDGFEFLLVHTDYLIAVTLQFRCYRTENCSIARYPVRRIQLITAYSKVSHSFAISCARATSLTWSTSTT